MTSPTAAARSRVRRGAYHDSIVLMRASAVLSAQPGIDAASVMMATPANRELLEEAGLLTAEAAAAGPNDLVIAVLGDAAVLDHVLDLAESELDRMGEEARPSAGRERRAPKSLREAFAAAPASNLALISTPGGYAAGEALKALQLGLHVFLFSDHVSVEQEVELKEEAARRGLLVMGPDCGTAIINGVPLGFANAVEPGPVGLIGASGTGLQQVSVLLDHAGVGLSQVVGVGSRDLSERVGARSMRAALEALAADPATAVIGLVSKPPSPAVAERVLELAAQSGKPVVACFLGARPEARFRSVHFAPTLAEAAAALAGLAGRVQPPAADADLDPRPPLGPDRHLVRALYSGGTFAYEALALWGGSLEPLQASVGRWVPGREVQLPAAHLVLDLGDDEFTSGRPHPMIDPSVRIEFLHACAEAPTAVVVLDVVLGYGAHDDPAGALAPAIARVTGLRDGPVVVAFVCGTARDPQGRLRQEQILREAGAVVAPSSTAAAGLAGRLVAGHPR